MSSRAAQASWGKGGYSGGRGYKGGKAGKGGPSSQGGKGGKGGKGGNPWWVTQMAAPVQDNTNEVGNKRSWAAADGRTADTVAAELKALKSRRDMLRWEWRALQVYPLAFLVLVWMACKMWWEYVISFVWRCSAGPLVYPLDPAQGAGNPGKLSQKVDGTRCKLSDPTPVQQNMGVPEPCPQEKNSRTVSRQVAMFSQHGELPNNYVAENGLLSVSATRINIGLDMYEQFGENESDSSISTEELVLHPHVWDESSPLCRSHFILD